MPFARPKLSDLLNQALQDITAALTGLTSTLLRFANLYIVGKVLANFANLHYGYLDWIAQQSVPFTATGEYLAGWAALKNVYREPATQATGAVTFTGTNGTLIPSGVALARSDGVAFTTTSAATIAGGTATVTAVANADPSGLTGAFGNTQAGVTMTLAQAIAGVQSNGTVTTAFDGGADLETDDDLRTRMLFAYQNPPQGGDQNDYVEWATQVPGVTRAWCLPNGFGVGTVVVYVMLDQTEAAFNGFPQGTNGTAAAETRGTVATGDQLLVANTIFTVQPVTALVWVVAPTANPIPFSIKGIPPASRVAALAAIADVFDREGSPGGTIILAHLWSAIAAVTGVNDFLILSPTTDIANGTGALPTVGVPTWS